MYDDLPLFTPGPATPGPLHRIPDHPTSIDAARAVRPTLTRLRQRVLELMVEAGEQGWTDNELRHLPEFAGYSHSTVGKRRTELYQLGYLQPSGERDGFTVWALKPEIPTAGILPAATPSPETTP